MILTKPGFAPGGRVPEGVSPEDWARARERAADAEIERLSKVGGFWPHKVKEAFRLGWCDTSGRVADYLTIDEKTC